MLADRQTDRRVDRDTPHIYLGGVIISRLRIAIAVVILSVCLSVRQSLSHSGDQCLIGSVRNLIEIFCAQHDRMMFPVFETNAERFIPNEKM